MVEKADNAVFAEQRRQRILASLEENGKVVVTELAVLFSVSEATIRKDLDRLERAGELQRTHGGAITAQKSGAVYELTSQQKETQNVRRKKAIALEAVKHVQEGDVIALDTGTTTRELARLLTKLAGITVITNDLKVAEILEPNRECVTVLLGGTLRHNFNCTIGKSALDVLRTYYADKAFMATNGISVKRGFSTPSLEAAEVKQKMIEISGSVIMLADSSKIGRESFATFAALKDVDLLITDHEADSDSIARLTEGGLKVVLT